MGADRDERARKRCFGLAVDHDGSLLHAVAPLAALPDCPIGKGEWQAGLDAYRALADAGGAHQRAVKHADLLIAAAARAAGYGVLPYYEDFDRIAGVTGQRCRWLAPRGTL